MSHLGEIFALTTALCWTVTSLCFASASRKVGSTAVNIIRLVLGFIFISIYTLLVRGSLLPLDASTHTWFWLSLSGFIGFFLGDAFLFAAYTIVSARIAMLIMALAPPIAAIAGKIFLNESMNSMALLGMFVTLAGIMLVVLKREEKENETRKIRLNYPLRGLLLAFGGAAGQGLGIVMSKYGMREYDAFASTQIRIIAGAIGFIAFILVMGRSKEVFRSLTNRNAMSSTATGSFFGPFLGVSFSLLAVQYTSSGIASTIIATVPVLLIVPAVFIYKEKIHTREIIGAIITVIGVALFFV